MKPLFFLFILLFFSTIYAQNEVENEIVYTELKSDNPEICPEGKAEYIDGINVFGNFIENSLQYPKSKIHVRVIEEKEKKKRKKNSSQPTNLKGIKGLNIEIANTDYVTRGAINSAAFGITPPRGYPAVIVADENVKGNILVGFVIEKDGMVSNVKIIESTCDKTYNDPQNVQLVKMLEAEFIRVIYLSAGKWSPAEINCETVRVYVTIPINWEHITHFNKV